MRRVVSNSTTLDKSRAEDAIIALLQFAKAPSHILGTVRSITHDNRYRLATKVLETLPDRKPKTGWRFIVDIAKRRVETLNILKDSFGLVRTIIVNYYNFVIDSFSGECLYQRTHNFDS